MTKCWKKMRTYDYINTITGEELHVYSDPFKGRKYLNVESKKGGRERIVKSGFKTKHTALSFVKRYIKKHDCK